MNTLQDLKQDKQEIEAAINKLLLDFANKYSVKISGINLDTHELNSWADDKYITANVECKIQVVLL